MTAINRKQLITKLEIVAPALAAHNLVPQMTHFWFTGKELMAYNDQIGISVPFKTDFQGAVPGALLSLLKTSTREEIDLAGAKGELKVKAGRSNWSLAMMGPDCFIFTMPNPKKSDVIGPNNMLRLVAALGGSLRSIGQDTSIPEQLGITIVPDGKAITLYTTNSTTISATKVKLGGDTQMPRLILSTQFCRQMLALAKPTIVNKKEVIDASLLIFDNQAMLLTSEATLFGRQITSERPFDFDKTITHHFPAGVRSKASPIPSGLKGALERASIICDHKVDQTKATMSIADGVLKLTSRSDRGEAVDKLKLDGDHRDISIAVEPQLLSIGLDDNFDQFVLDEKSVVMTNERGDIYLVSASTPR
jgi:DNA polymerase III sliding clamp (beta) subunit (PCNA family)